MSRRKSFSSKTPANRKSDRQSKLRGGLRQPTRRGLRCESLERRELLASDIAGLVMVDCGEEVAAEVADVEGSAETNSTERSRESTRAPEGEQSVLNIRFDYSLDTSTFFTDADGPRKKELLDLAARVLTRQLADTLDAIPAPPNKFTWAPVIEHPVTGRQFTLPGNPTVPANEIVIYAGARNFTGLQRAEAGPGSINFNSEGGLTQEEFDAHVAFKQLLDTRGELGAIATPASDFAPITGWIAFDVDTNWDFDDGTAIDFDEFRFLNFAIHELGHALGYGTSPSWAADVAAGRYQGANSIAAYTGSGAVPLSGDAGHWNDSVGINVGTEGVGQPTLMTPTVPSSLFETFSVLDFAGLRDIGWETFAMPGPALSLDAATASIAEDGGAVTVSATLAAATDVPVAVPLTIAGSAEATDYTSSADFLYIAPGQRTASITLDIQDDDVREEDETVTVTLGAPTNATLGSTATQTITILQNDQPPTVDFTVDTQAVEETVGAVTVTAQLSEATDEIVTVPLTFTGNANDEDFSASANELTIAAGATTGTITLTVINDPVPEGDETIQIAMGTPTNADLGTTTSQTVTINENDQPPEIQFTTAAPDPVEENVGNVILTVSIPTASESEISVPVTFAGTADGDDYTASATEFTIPVGQTSATLTLSITDEEVRENDETIVARLGTPTNAVLGSVSQQTVTIQQNDQPPTIEFSVATQDTFERSGSVTVTATLSKTSAQEVTVPLTFSGSANDQDYTRSAESITIAAGATSGSVTLAINNDTDPEPAETIIVTLGTPDGADLGTIRSQTVNIAASDQPPVIELSTDRQVVNEASGNVTVTAQLSKVWTEEVTVQVGFSGTANAQDFTASATSITIPVGQTSGSVTLAITDDDETEVEETITVTLSSPTESSLGTIRSQDVVIAASDQPPVVNWTTDAQSVEESVGTVTLNATLSFAAATEVAIPLTYGGTAARDSDYTAANATLVIAAGQTTGSVQLNVINDADEEALETIIVSLGAATGVELGDTTSQTISIAANDPRPTVDLTTATQPVMEDVGTVTVTATLSATSESNIVIPLTFAGTAGVTDYTASASSISIPAGQTSGTVTLTINDDDLVENDDTIVIALGQPTDAVLGTTTSQTITIIDNNMPAPVIQFSTGGIDTGTGDIEGQSFDIDVTLSRAIDVPVTVPISVTGNGDATLSNSMITVAAGQTSGTVSLMIVDDTDQEADETLELTLGNPTNATLGSANTLSLTIPANDATPVVTIAANETDIPEDVGTVTITASLSAAATSEVTVPLTFAGQADSEDYSASANAFTFATGQTQATVTLTIVDDEADEENETLIINYGSPSNAVLEAGSLNFLIVDNDDPVASTSRILAPNVITRPYVIPGDGEPTAIIFRASESTTLEVMQLTGSEQAENFRLLDENLQTIASDADSSDGTTASQRGELNAGELYAVLFLPRSSQAIFTIRSSAGFDAVTNSSPTNLLRPTDVNASGEPTALDALMIINHLNQVDLNLANGEPTEAITASADQVGPFYDVNRDGHVSAADALRVINELNRQDGYSPSSEPVLAPSATNSSTVDEVFTDSTIATGSSETLIAKSQKISSFATAAADELASVQLTAGESQKSSDSVASVDAALTAGF